MSDKTVPSGNSKVFFTIASLITGPTIGFLFKYIITGLDPNVPYVVGFVTTLILLQSTLIYGLHLNDRATNTTSEQLMSFCDNYEFHKLVNRIQGHEHEPGIADAKARIKKDLEDLAKSAYHVFTESKIYKEDISLLKSLRPGEDFIATVVVSDDPHGQFDDGEFLNYMKAQKKAVQDGIKVTRIYLVRDHEQYADECLQSHLESLHGAGIHLLYFILEDASPGMKERYKNADYLTFGRAMVAFGKTEERMHSLIATTFSRNKSDVTNIQHEIDVLMVSSKAWEPPVPALATT